MKRRLATACGLIVTATVVWLLVAHWPSRPRLRFLEGARLARQHALSKGRASIAVYQHPTPLLDLRDVAVRELRAQGAVVKSTPAGDVVTADFGNGLRVILDGGAPRASVLSYPEQGTTVFLIDTRPSFWEKLKDILTP